MDLPIGYDIFREVIDDKSTQAVVITRARRFGKTLNLSMLHHFLANEAYGKSTAVWSLLVMAGYLKITAQRHTDQGTLCTLSIPNREVRNLYRQIIEQWLSNGYGIQWYNNFLDHLLTGNVAAFENDAHGECTRYGSRL